MNLAAIDPALPSLIGAITTLALGLGLNELWRRRKQNQQDAPVAPADIDRIAAETILTQWKAVLEASQARAEWERDEHRRCEERNQALDKRLEECEEGVRALKWEIARRDWTDSQPKPRRRRDGAAP